MSAFGGKADIAAANTGQAEAGNSEGSAQGVLFSVQPLDATHSPNDMLQCNINIALQHGER
jgi:hypothetical protein